MATTDERPNNKTSQNFSNFSLKLTTKEVLENTNIIGFLSFTYLDCFEFKHCTVYRNKKNKKNKYMLAVSFARNKEKRNGVDIVFLNKFLQREFEEQAFSFLIKKLDLNKYEIIDNFDLLLDDESFVKDVLDEYENCEFEEAGI